MKTLRPPRGKGASAILMFAMGFTILSVFTLFRGEGRERLRAAEVPKDRPLVLAIATLENAIESEELDWLHNGIVEAIEQNLSRQKQIQLIPRRLIRRAESTLRPGEHLGVLAGPLQADLVLGGEVWEKDGKIGVSLIALSPRNSFAAADLSPFVSIFSQAGFLSGDILGYDPDPWFPVKSLDAYASYVRGLRIYDEAATEKELLGAETLFTEALEKEPEFFEAVRARAAARLWRYRASKDVSLRDKALEDITLALKNLSDDARTYEIALQIFAETNDDSKALSAATQFFQKTNQYAPAAYRLSSQLLQYGLDEDAKALLQDTVLWDENAAPALLDLGILHLLHKEESQAKPFLQRAFDLEESYRASSARSPLRLRGWTPIAGSRTYLAMYQLRTGKNTESIVKLLDEDEGLYPFGGSKFGLADKAIRQRVRGEILQNMDAALQTENALLDSNPKIGAALGWALLVIDANRAKDIVLSSPQKTLKARLQSARILEISGNKEQALALVEEALLLAKTREEVKIAQRRLSLLQGESLETNLLWLTE